MNTSAYNPAGIRAHLRTVLLGRRIEVYPQVSSTNDLVRELGRRGEPEGLVIAAEEQLQGRGRLNRSWVAPAGCCVLCSVLLRPRFPPEYAFYLTMIAALAIRRASTALLSGIPGGRPSVTLKWPNDVMLRGRKLAGVLSESEFGANDWEMAVVGFGINTNLRVASDLPVTAASLSDELGREVDRARLLAAVLSEMEGLYLSLQSGQFAGVYEQWAGALDTVGKRVTVSEAGGSVTGKAVQVDRDGALVLRTDDGMTRRVLAGDVWPAQG